MNWQSPWWLFLSLAVLCFGSAYFDFQDWREKPEWRKMMAGPSACPLYVIFGVSMFGMTILCWCSK